MATKVAALAHIRQAFIVENVQTKLFDSVAISRINHIKKGIRIIFMANKNTEMHSIYSMLLRNLQFFLLSIRIELCFNRKVLQSFVI